MTQRRRKPRSRQPPSGSPNPPTIPKLLQESHLDIAKWEVEKLKHNLDIQTIPYSNRLSPLLPGYIPTLAALEEIASTSAFVALDTESVPHCYKATDVGLAFIPTLDRAYPSGKGDPTLEKFVKEHHVEAASFKVNGRYHDIYDKLKSMSSHVSGRTHRPMEPLRFGREQFVDIEELDAALRNQIEQFRRVVPEKQLILVGLSLQSDFERLSLEFPGIVELFPRWIDLSTLMKAQSLTPTKLETGLGTALTIFHYPYRDTGFDRRHQASNDAVRTLAALYGLMDPKNIASVLLRQHEFAGIEIAARIDHFASKVYRALLHVDRKDLPPLIDSAQKLALAVQKFKPIGVAADCSNAKNPQKKHPTSIHTVCRTCGCVCFKSNKALQHFISAMNGKRYDNAVLKVVRAPLPQQIQTQISKGKKLNMKRKIRRKQRTPDIDWSDSFRNTFLVEDDPEEEEQEIPVVETTTQNQTHNELPAQAGEGKEADADDNIDEVAKEPIENASEDAPHAVSIIDQINDREAEVKNTEVGNVNEAGNTPEHTTTDQHSLDERNTNAIENLRDLDEESDIVPGYETAIPRTPDHNTNIEGKKRPSWLSRLKRKVLRKVQSNSRR
ncbi:hypothetical protein HD806DRAFT_493609 [Xylariaceae sp. AK1471]|nr:hypothetical protein HD806DRAFT_493609 [Xylariaceae sp. AK1471]